MQGKGKKGFRTRVKKVKRYERVSKNDKKLGRDTRIQRMKSMNNGMIQPFRKASRLSHRTENRFVTFVIQFPNLSAADGTINHRRHLQNVKRKEEEGLLERERGSTNPLISLECIPQFPLAKNSYKYRSLPLLSDIRAINTRQRYSVSFPRSFLRIYRSKCK